MHYSLLYISRVVKPISVEVLSAIREQSIQQNQATGVTGLLLWSHDHFCQILQGHKPAVEETMRRIERDTRHVEPIVLLRTDLAEALFPNWSMATSHIDDTAVAHQIAVAYLDRLANLSVVDGIIALMQQFQLNSQYKTPIVYSRTGLDQQLATLAANDASDQAIKQVLQLGTSIFQGCALLLLLRPPCHGEYYLKSYTGITASDVNSLICHLCLENSAIEATKCSTETTSIRKNVHQIILPETARYRTATGCDVCTNVSVSPVLSGTTPAAANRSEVIGSLWVLTGLPTHEAIKPANRIELFRLTSCIENLLEQRIKSHASELLKHMSRRQQLSLAASNRRQEMVMNVASSAIVALDRQCRVLIINDAARQLFGQITDPVPFHWPASIVFRSPWSLEPLPHSDCPVHLAATKNIEHDTGTGATEGSTNLVALQKDESQPLRYLKVASSRTDDPESAISGVVVFDDVTELQHNRERIRRSDRLEALGHLTGGIAHDFNNLLSTIQSSVELATVEPDHETRQSFLTVALDSVQRGADLTDKLVAFAVARPASAQAHHLEDVIQSIADLVTASIEQDINFVLEDIPDSLTVYCDGGQLENALLNVLINSRDAIMESGTGDRVSIAARSIKPTTVASPAHQKIPSSTKQESSEKVQIIITDNGPGMSAEVIRRATDPFFTTRAGASGSGLGLSMVYRFVEQSDGELLIENMSDIHPDTTGVRVTLILDQAPSQSTKKEVSQPEKPVPQQSRASVLLVEDETNLAQMLQHSLNRFGLETRVTHSADTALQVLKANNDIDLLLTDIIMPGSDLDGYSLAAEAIRLKPGLKVVYLSGYPQQSGKSPATTYGPLINKPVSMKKLADIIRKELGHAVHDSNKKLVPG